MRHQLFGVKYQTWDTHKSIEIFFNTSFAIGFSFQPAGELLIEALIIHLLFVEIRFCTTSPNFEFSHYVSSLWEKLVALWGGAIVSDWNIHFTSIKDADHYLWLMRSDKSATQIEEEYWGPSDDECEDQYPYEDYEGC
jgi:hypothetical protein